MNTSDVNKPSASQAPAGEHPMAWYVRVGLVIAVGASQLLVFYVTYRLYHVIEYPYYVKLETFLDHIVPYLSWSWIIYYFGFV